MGWTQHIPDVTSPFHPFSYTEGITIMVFQDDTGNHVGCPSVPNTKGELGDISRTVMDLEKIRSYAR